MRKLFLAIMAILLLASPLLAAVQTEHGIAEWELVYIKAPGAALTSGSVVVLYTSGTTYPGQEVTETTTSGLPIYGVYTGDETYSQVAGTDLSDGIWIPIQKRGYVKAIACNGDAISAGEMIATADTAFRAQGTNASYATAGVTGNCIKLGSTATNADNLDFTAGWIEPTLSSE